MLDAAIEAQLAGARARVRGSEVVAEIPLENTWFRARLACAPVAVVAVQVPDTDGFSLALRWNDRWVGDRAPRAATFDDSFLVETNDLVLAAAWLDHDSRSALLASRYVSVPGDRHTAVMLRDGAWEHHIGGAEVSARRRDAELSVHRMLDMLVAMLARSPRSRARSTPAALLASRSAAVPCYARSAAAPKSPCGSSAGSVPATLAACARSSARAGSRAMARRCR
jgi:hypothetical protein